jgi:dCTP deaminase
VLSDRSIVAAIQDGSIAIEPFSVDFLRPASYVLRLGDEIARFEHKTDPVVLNDATTYPKLVRESLREKPRIIFPGEFVLAGTFEKITLAKTCAGALKNLTGLSRLGLAVEISSLISPGFGSQGSKPLTLEMRNYSSGPIELQMGMRVCHLVFFTLTEVSWDSYDEKIGVHTSPVAPASSQYFEYFKKQPK